MLDYLDSPLCSPLPGLQAARLVLYMNSPGPVNPLQHRVRIGLLRWKVYGCSRWGPVLK